MRRRTSPSTPRVAPVELPDLVDAEPADLDAGVLLDGVALRGLDLPPVNLAGAELVEVLVSRLTADDVDLTGARLREVAVEDARVNAWRMGRAHVQDAQFSGRFGVLDAQGGTWRSLILAGCKVDLLSLRGADVTDVLLRDCQVGELDLSGARVTRVRLEASHVGTMEAHELRSEHLDLRGATIDRFVSLAGLRGALVTADQVTWWATALAEALGLRVVEEQAR